MKILFTIAALFLSFASFCQASGSGVVDVDGNSYSTVIIGTQEWMAENLRVEAFSNGDPITYLPNGNFWVNTSLPARGYYNDNVQNLNDYGYLYNGIAAVDSRNICPNGWRVPSDSDWNTLACYLDPQCDTVNNFNVHSYIAGGILKETGTSHWLDPNTDATNSVGFSALPGGQINVTGFNGGSQSINEYGVFLSSTLVGSSNTSVYYRIMSFTTGILTKNTVDWRHGYSIRCLNSNFVGLEEIKLEKRELVKVVGLLGQETEPKPNTPLIYIYSDGTTEKVFLVE